MAGEIAETQPGLGGPWRVPSTGKCRRAGGEGSAAAATGVWCSAVAGDGAGIDYSQRCRNTTSRSIQFSLRAAAGGAVFLRSRVQSADLSLAIGATGRAQSDLVDESGRAGGGARDVIRGVMAWLLVDVRTRRIRVDVQPRGGRGYFCGGLWTTLLTRQVTTAFWFSIRYWLVFPASLCRGIL